MESIWREISTSRWVADVGLPLLGTIAAIGAAWWGIRRQLSQDRALWQAQRHAEAARQLGAALIAAYEEYGKSRMDSQFWKHGNWISFPSVRKAVSSARVILGPTTWLRELELGAIDLMQAWRACQDRRHLLQKDGDKVADVAAANALEAVIYPQLEALNTAGEILVAWNGLDVVPKMEWPVLHIPRMQPRNPDRMAKRKAWLRYFADTYEAEIAGT